MTNTPISGIAVYYGIVIREDTFFERHLEQIRAAAPGADIVVIRKKEEWTDMMAKRCEKFEVFLGKDLDIWINKLPALKWAQLSTAGADWALGSPDVLHGNVFLTNASGVHAIPIAEHILSMMFAFGHNMHHHMRYQLAGKWKRRTDIKELEGTTLGLIGAGRIGEKTAEKARALNMKVLGVRRNPDRSSPFIDRMYGPDQLDEMLPRCDWVVITAAGTSETEGMIGEAELAAMKDSAVLINIARGSLIRESALIKALEEERIAGAGLDVFETEPLPADSPLWKMSNVIITPHVAGGTPHYMDRLMDIFTENLRRYQAGEDLINLVDKQLGY